MPKLKEKIVDKLRCLDEHFTEQEGQRGILEAEKTRIRLKNQKIQQKRLKKRQLEEMIQLTAQTNVMHAIKLNELLQPSWTEEPGSYKILSKITTQKQKNRLRELTSSVRYF